jgi:hypothetical protein
MAHTQMQRGDRQPARHFARQVFLSLARILALVWLAPALLFNVDWSGHGTVQANTAAVLMILGSALFIEGAMRARSWLLTPLCICAALFLVYVNTKQATRVLSLVSEAASEAKSSDIASASQLASQRSHLLARREVQVELAGETTVGALEAQLQQLTMSDLRAWNATSQCEDVTARASGVFCAKVAEAKARIEAAKARDKIDAELMALPTPKVVAVPGAEAVADAYVANVVALLREAGFRPTERLVRAEEALARAFSFELLAALGPTCWLMFINGMVVVGSAVSRRTPSPKAPKQVSEIRDTSPAPTDPADDLDRCIADAFEADPTGVMLAKDIRPVVQAWFERQGIGKPVEKALWAKMRERFKHDPNGGRPRYFGLKARVKAPPKLAVVSSA